MNFSSKLKLNSQQNVEIIAAPVVNHTAGAEK